MDPDFHQDDGLVGGDGGGKKPRPEPVSGPREVRQAGRLGVPVFRGTR